MKYELAKELKDSGFPLYWGSEWDIHNDPSVVPHIVPILSELIEACGIAFISLVQIDAGKWAAKGGTRAFAGIELIPEILAEGSTPKEAVARLWLALNKKA